MEHDPLKLELETRLAWQLNSKLRERHRGLYIRMGYSDILPKAYPGEEVADLVTAIYNKEGKKGLHRFYELLKELEETTSLELINASPAAELFRDSVSQSATTTDSNQGSSINKFLIVPKNSPTLSTSFDDIFDTFGFYALHKCALHTLWFYPKKMGFDCRRYVLKFSVGEINVAISTSDALKKASEVMFAFFNQGQSTLVENFNDLEAGPVKTCFEILLRTLRQTLKGSIPHQLYSISPISIPLHLDAEIAFWLADTQNKAKERFYCCARFEEIDRELHQIEGIPQSILKQFTGLDIEVHSTTYGSVNVCFSGDSILPVMLQLHKEDISHAFKSKGLTLISMFELSIQDVSNMLAIPRNSKFESQLGRLKQRMISDQVPTSLGSDRWNIELLSELELQEEKNPGTSTTNPLQRKRLLADLKGIQISIMAEEIGEYYEWRLIGLRFHPKVTYEALEAQHPDLTRGDIDYCKAMINTLASRGVTLDDFLDAVDDSGLIGIAYKLRKLFDKSE